MTIDMSWNVTKNGCLSEKGTGNVGRVVCLSPSVSLSLFLHRCVSTFVCVQHTIDTTDTLNFVPVPVPVPVYDVQIQDFYFHLSSRIVT
jgi:hypothetical protein